MKSKDDDSDLSLEGYKRIEGKALKVFPESKEVDLFLQLSRHKVVKIASKGNDKKEEVEKFEKKGNTNFHLSNPDFFTFVKTVKENLVKKMNEEESQEDASSDPPKKLFKMSAAHSILKSLMGAGSFPEDTQVIAKNITRQSIKVINSTNIFERFQEFRENCTAEYMRAITTAYIVCLMIDHFSWGSDQVKEKVVLAALLCDITLEEEDFQLLQKEKSNVKNLPKKIIDHPNLAAELIASKPNFASSETLSIIKQHHERPNGKGFPEGIGHHGITPLTAVYIVANYFVETMYSTDFDEKHLEERTKNILVTIVEKFTVGNYKKAATALQEVLQ